MAAAPPPAESASLPPAESPVRPPLPKIAIGELPGMSEAQIVALFGRPQFRRTETPAEIWQYRGAACVLHVFLYRKGTALLVRHAEARPRDVGSDGAAVAGAPVNGAAAEDCLGQLAASRQTG